MKEQKQELPKQNDVREDDVENQVPDVRKMVEEYGATCNQLYKDWLKIGFVAGYNKAKENTYTEEEVREAFILGMESSSKYSPKSTFEEFIQSLKQPK